MLDGGLAGGLTYQYRVRAYNDAGFSPYAGPAAALVPLAPPEVLGLEPAEGPSSGGTAVVIRGRNFQGEVTTLLGGALLKELRVLSREEIQARTPPGARGLADLVVKTSQGEAARPAAFVYFDSFPRGDANGDSRRDLSDVIFILDDLFLAGPAPPCQDVGDANHDGEVDLGDPLFLLFLLFADGPPPDPDEARCFSELNPVRPA